MVTQGASAPLTVCTVYTPSETYSLEYVERLAEGVARHLCVPHRFLVLSPVQTPFETLLISAWPDAHWAKVNLFSPVLRGRILYIDLSTVVTGSLDDIAAQEGICITRDFYFGGPSQSILLYDGGELDCLWVAFWNDPEGWIQKGSSGIIPDFHDQTLFNHIKTPPYRYWQDVLPGQVVSWKADCKEGVPDNARLVKFHGKPRPADVSWLESPKYVQTLNTDTSVMLEHIEANLERGLPLVDEVPAHERTMAIVGGGPSLADTLNTLRFTGADIFALNGAHDYLIEHNIYPRYMVMLDARAENVTFVQNPSDRVEYLISAMCHPGVFDALEGCRVTTWVPEMDGTRDMPILRVGGGATVGMKALYMGYIMGYRSFELYGMDSSYRETHHAYAQPLNDGEDKISAFVGEREFTCAPWMLKQAQEFQNQAAVLSQRGCSISVAGDGLLPYVASLMRAS